MKEQFNFRIDADILNQMKSEAESQGISPSGYAVKAIAYCLSQGVVFNVPSTSPPLDILGSVNEILREFRSEMATEMATQLEAGLAGIEARLEARLVVGNNEVPQPKLVFQDSDDTTNNDAGTGSDTTTGDDAGTGNDAGTGDDDDTSNDAGTGSDTTTGDDAGTGDDDTRVLAIIKAGRESDPPLSFEKIADDLVHKGLTVAGKSGRRIKPTRTNVKELFQSKKE